jgi:hypothetical protein
MKIFSNFKYILIISAIILIMMIIKVCQNNAWPGNAGKAAEIIALHKNFITMENLRNVSEQVTLIKTGPPVSDTLISSFPGVNASWEEMMDNEFLRKINQPNHKVVIVSGSKAEGVRAWVLLNQMGIKDLFVLEQKGMNNELFKYQFQPDTTMRLELENTEER